MIGLGSSPSGGTLGFIMSSEIIGQISEDGEHVTIPAGVTLDTYELKYFVREMERKQREIYYTKKLDELTQIPDGAEVERCEICNQELWYMYGNCQYELNDGEGYCECNRRGLR